MIFLGLLLFVFTIYAQPQYFISALHGVPVVAIVMQFVLAGLFLKKFADKQAVFVKAPQSRVMIMLWIMITLSTLSVHWLRFTWATFLEWGKVVLIYFAIINLVDSREKIRRVFAVMVLGMVVTATLGVMQFHGFDVTGMGTQLEGRIRGVGIFDTNQLAYGLDYTLPFVFAILMLPVSAFAKIKNFSYVTLFSYCVYLTQSRGGMLCLGATIMATVILCIKNLFVKIVGLGGVVLLALVFLFLSTRLSTIGDYQSDESSMNRLYAWGEGLSALKENPVLGIGKDQFMDRFKIAAHSSYVEAAAELGFIGFYAWVALFYFSFRNLRYIVKGDESVPPDQMTIYAKALMVSLAAYLLGSLFSSSAYYMTLYIMFSLVVVLQQLVSDSVREKCRTISFRDFGLIGIIEFGVVAFIHLWVKIAA